MNGKMCWLTGCLSDMANEFFSLSLNARIEAVVMSVPSAAFTVLRYVRCVAYVACVALDKNPA